MIDLAIVGKGPAGWSCAMTARMRGLEVVVIAPQNDNALLKSAERVDNYPGLPAASGGEILKAFRKQALELGVKEKFGLVRQIMPLGDQMMMLVENDVVEAKAVVLAMGAARATMLDGEEENIGNGVSYCATCDGMFYRGKKIAVLSGSVQGAEETHFLADLAAQVDYYSIKRHEMPAFADNVKLVNEKPVRISRENTGMKLETDVANRTYDGIFIFRAAVPLNMLIADLETDGAYIKVDRMMKTNIPGVFAAGDCTGTPLQIPKAVGEGNIAAISAAEWIAQMNK